MESSKEVVGSITEKTETYRMENHNFTKQNDKAESFSQKVKQFTRIVFKISENDMIMVSELSCAEPFCPDVMTLIAFWGENNQRKEYRIYKQMRFITEYDVEEAKNSMLNVLINKELAEKKL